MSAQPQDHKPKAEKSLEPATFTHEGETYTLPPRSAIKSGMLRRHRNKDPQDYVFSLLEETADEKTLAALDELDIDEMDTVIGAWSDHVFGVDPGKS